MESVWILGAGKFGQKAVEAVRRKDPKTEVTVIEKNANVCRQTAHSSYEIICMDGVEFLTKNLKDPDTPDWIIPVVPIHVAFEWIKAKISADHQIKKLTVPEQLAASLPNTWKGENDRLYISNADFVCPEDCPQPEELCTFTGEPRPCKLYQKLESLQHADFQSIVIRSWQLSPGVGGYRPIDMFNALNKVLLSKKSILLSTACDCHGVMDAFKILRQQKAQ
jgi:hypothetical protein